MKKLTKYLFLTVMMMLFIIPMSAHAEELDSIPDEKEEKFQQRKENITNRKEERLEALEIKFDEKKEKALERQEKALEIVEEYANDLFDEYETAFETHNALHTELFETHQQLREQYFAASMDELETLKEELFEQLDNGEITGQEAREALKLAKKELREEYKNLITEIKSIFADAAFEEEQNKEVRQALKAELKGAIEDNDLERAEEILAELYDYLLKHNDYDQLKLDTYKSYLEE